MIIRITQKKKGGEFFFGRPVNGRDEEVFLHSRQFAGTDARNIRVGDLVETDRLTRGYKATPAAGPWQRYTGEVDPNWNLPKNGQAPEQIPTNRRKIHAEMVELNTFAGQTFGIAVTSSGDKVLLQPEDRCQLYLEGGDIVFERQPGQLLAPGQKVSVRGLIPSGEPDTRFRGIYWTPESDLIRLQRELKGMRRRRRPVPIRN